MKGHWESITQEEAKERMTCVSCTAQLTFSSFDGGGYEYTFITDEPEIIALETRRDYHGTDPAQVEGAAYDVILTVRALKEGSTTLTVQARSPILEAYDEAYYVTVDGALQVRISDPVRYEITDGTRITDEAVRPFPTALIIECEGGQFYAQLEDNESARAFAEKLWDGSITVQAHDYGNFEKVGPLPWSLPDCDESITTKPGDVILYQGNQITVYYDTNTWSFTRLAVIPDVTREELLAVLGKGNVELTFYIEWSE